MRLMVCCSELGLGHVSRVIPLGKKIKERGNVLFFFSGGKAFQLLQKQFKNVYHCTPVAWYENASGIIASASLVNILVPLPFFNYEKNKVQIKSSSAMETIHRYYDLRRYLRKIKPDLIVADGDLHALRLAARWKFPSVYISNLIRPSYGFSPLFNPGERFVERYLRQCTKIIIPDNPPPYTICEYNLGDLERMGLSAKTEFVGSFLDTEYVKGEEKHVFASISGPYGTRIKLAQVIVPVLEELETKGIVSLGMPGKKISVKRGNCEMYGWLSSQERQECMKNAELVIFSGGHRTCFETIKYGKPSICVPTQPEQMGNARKLQKLNCSISVKDTHELKVAIQRISKEYQYFKKNIAKLSSFTRKFKGLRRSVEVIENSAE